MTLTDAITWARTADAGDYLVTYTDADIEQLGVEAGEHGDLAQVALCEAALAGDSSARAKCERVLSDADAQRDSGSRCGFGDDELDAIRRVLGKRDLLLRTDDKGLYAEESPIALQKREHVANRADRSR